MKDKFFSGVQKASEFLQRPTPPIVESTAETIIDEVIETVKTELPPPPPPPNTDKEEAEYEEPLSDEDLEDQAETYLVLLEMVLNLIFSVAAKYKRNNKAVEIAGENGVEKMKAVVKKLKSNERAKKNGGVINIDQLTEEEKLLSELHSDVENFLDETDLSDAEKRKLMKPLVLIVKKRKKKLSPEQLFFAGLASIAVTRLAMFKML
ncbi:hypothetical protein ACFOW1_09565 [Parasediminibacterium paludis]|uniref:Uncharacterized protein n=1 Tax=Parasediminibacterium paludis TaxID=908966 RepID=A0ABV8PVK9_9BACT